MAGALVHNDFRRCRFRARYFRMNHYSTPRGGWQAVHGRMKRPRAAVSINGNRCQEPESASAHFSPTRRPSAPSGSPEPGRESPARPARSDRSSGSAGVPDRNRPPAGGIVKLAGSRWGGRGRADRRSGSIRRPVLELRPLSRPDPFPAHDPPFLMNPSMIGPGCLGGPPGGPAYSRFGRKWSTCKSPRRTEAEVEGPEGRYVVDAAGGPHV